MKFAQQLRQGAVEEWRRAYVDYRLLKKLIKVAARSEEADGVDDETHDSNHPLNLPSSPPPDTTLSESPEELRDSSDDERVQPQPPLQRASASRVVRVESRTSSHDLPYPETRPAGLRQRRKSRTSLKESRWKYPPDLPYDEMLTRLNPQERKFFGVLDDQLDKVESFYEERESEALNRFKVLQEQLDQLATHRAEYLARHSKPSRFLLHQAPGKLKSQVLPATSDGNESPRDGAKGTGSDWPQHNKSRSHTPTHFQFQFNPENYIAARRKLKLAVFEFYKYLGYVKNYRLLNRTGFSKSTKKMEKMTRIKCQEAYMTKVHKAHFSSSTVIDDLQVQTESMFGASFEKGSTKKAIQRLRSLGTEGHTHHFASWRAGMMLGAALPALIDGLVRACQEETHRRIPAWPAMLQLYGSFLLPVLLGFGIGINLLGWSRSHINIPLVFYFDTRNHIDYRQFLEIPSLFFFTLCYCFWLSMTVVSVTVSAQVWPLVWLFSTILILFNPLPVFHRTARWWLIKSTTRVFLAGIVRVQFRDFWLGDQFASLYYTAYNLGLLVCAYSHHWSPDVPSTCSTNETWASPVLASLPYLWRLGQSIRRYHDSKEVRTHLVNAGKYGMGVLYFFMYFNYRIHGSEGKARLALFIVFATLNSTYSCTWDYLMDWNIFKRNAKHRFLRNEIAYKAHVWFYYFAIVTNLLLRFSWVIYFAPHPDLRLKGFLVSLLETFRRWQWNFIRVESEHVGNIDGFRVTRDVPLPYTIPSHASASASVLGDDAEEELEEQVSAGGAKGVGREKGAAPVAVPLDSRTSSFAQLLPGEVARRFKAAIFGTPGGPTYPDESDDEDDSGPDNRRDAGHSSSNNDSEAEQGSTQRKRPTNAQAPDQRQNAKNYNTFGYDADVENVRAARE